MPEETPDTLVVYRLDELQRSLTTLNTAVASLGTQIMSLQISLPDRYLTRQEFAEIVRQSEFRLLTDEKRITEIEEGGRRRDEALITLERNWTSRSLGFLGTIIISGISFIVGIGNILLTATHNAPK